MADTAKLLAAAEKTIKDLGNVATVAASSKSELEKTMKNADSIKAIREEISADEKPIAGWNKEIIDAKKEQGELDKLKDDASKKVAGRMKEAVAKAEKAVKDLAGALDMSKKIADKSEKEDVEIGNKLKKAIPMAEDAIEEIGGLVIGTPGTLELLAKDLKEAATKKQFINQAKIDLGKANEAMKRLGAAITTGESVKASLGPIVKEGLGAYIPAVKADAKKAQDLEGKLATKCKDGRTFQNTLIAKIKSATDELKKLGG
jgi:DNA repair exonuclease SbcCD ATPase subunit